jgi:predicted phosphodiesterase
VRLAILTDLHANREAVSACLDHAASQDADQYAFLGDLVDGQAHAAVREPIVPPVIAPRRPDVRI